MLLNNLHLSMHHRLRFTEVNARVLPENGNQSNVRALLKQKFIKKSMLLLVALFICTSIALKAQSPQKINFQSIVRNTNGVIVSNKSVSFKITILSGSITGTPVYSETHLKTTDAIGLVSLQIGTGTVASGVFSSIDWGNAVHFIKLDADFSGGNTYVNLGIQELMSVPYAMYAAKTDTNSLNLTNRLADKAPVNNPTFTGTVGGIDKAMVGLGSVDNTKDVDKQVSSATQTALNAKVNIADTSNMLANYRTGINSKVNIADTSNMLANYQTGISSKVNIADTSNMLANYRSGINAKLNTIDTTILSNRISTKLNGKDTAFLSSRIDTKLSATDTSSLSNRIDTKFNKADFPSGSSANEILYWNGTKWISLQPGLPGQVLTMSSDGLSWGCITANSADTASSNPTVTVNSPLTPITIATTGATGIFPAQYLPQGVTAAWSANVITISGTPAASGTFTYTIPLTGGCGTVSATGTITVVDASVPGDVVDVVVTDGLEEGEVIVTFSPPLSDGGSPIIEYEVEATEEEVTDVNSPTISSYSQKNILIENSTITSNDIPLTMIEDTNEPVSGFVVSSITRTKGLKSPITVKGLKISVSYIFKVFAKNLIGSSPPPSNSKTQKFIPKVFPCAAGSASSSPSLIQNTALTNITHKTTKATGIGSASGLPQGVTAAWSGNTITISGTPAAAGVFNYTIPITGLTCNNVNATGTITVEAPPCGSNITYNDYSYSTVSIGDQCWMAENLRTRKYNDGTDIPFDASGGADGKASDQTWGALKSGAHTLYAHDSTANPSNLTSYGYLYNWYAVDSKKLCPDGWHVPTDAEWKTLMDSLGGESVAGGKMKSTGTTYWEVQKVGTDNSSGFSGLPGGFRYSDGSFRNIRDGALFWSATAIGPNNAWERRLGSLNGDVFRGFSNNSFGYSVRCLKNKN